MQALSLTRTRARNPSPKDPANPRRARIKSQPRRAGARPRAVALPRARSAAYACKRRKSEWRIASLRTHSLLLVPARAPFSAIPFILSLRSSPVSSPHLSPIPHSSSQAYKHELNEKVRIGREKKNQRMDEFAQTKRNKTKDTKKLKRDW